MSVGFVLTIMVLTTKEKVFIFEHYLRSYGVGHQNEPGLRFVREHYEEQFNEKAPSNKTILIIVEKFHRTGSSLLSTEGNNWALEDRHHKRGSWTTSPSVDSPQSVVYDEHRWNLVWATDLLGGCLKR